MPMHTVLHMLSPGWEHGCIRRPGGQVPHALPCSMGIIALRMCPVPCLLFGVWKKPFPPVRRSLHQ